MLVEQSEVHSKPENTEGVRMEGIIKRSMRLMGNQFEISIVGDDEAWALDRIEEAVSEIKRIENLLTTFNETSETAKINAHAGIKPVSITQEVFDLIQRSIRISDITQGAFDITYGSIDKSLWNFDKNMTALPDAATAKSMVRLINYRNIDMNTEGVTVFLKEHGMRIGFGGIGKGYAAEMAKKVLQNKGVKSGIVNASGDLVTWGVQPDGSAWTIGVANPDDQQSAFSYLEISNMAVATSGNYEKYVVIDGKKYSHTINPKTGYPVSGIKSVTIISPNAELSDAFATPVMVMGVKVGLDMINQIKGMGCIIIDEQNKLFASKHIRLL
jgi:FAD:protein FMN transferase